MNTMNPKECPQRYSLLKEWDEGSLYDAYLRLDDDGKYVKYDDIKHLIEDRRATVPSEWRPISEADASHAEEMKEARVIMHLVQLDVCRCKFRSDGKKCVSCRAKAWLERNKS